MKKFWKHSLNSKFWLNGWGKKNQLDVTCYFISLIMCSTCFGHKYIHLQEPATVLMNYHVGRLVLSSLCVGVFAAADIWWCSFCRLKHYCSVRRRLLKMDILMSETYWAHNKWNEIASDIKLVFHSSTIAMMHCPINIRFDWMGLGSSNILGLWLGDERDLNFSLVIGSPDWSFL